MHPKISIVTPSYNAEKFIEETIKSVVNQNYDNFEYIVMDGGSTDGTISILQKYERMVNNPQKFRWISEKDNGQTDAINKGMRLCTGDWFAFLNADDFYAPNLFADIAAFLKENKDKGVIYGNQYALYDGLDENYNLLKKPDETITFEDLLYSNRIYGPASFYNMAALKKTGEFDAELYHWMDWDMYLRIAKIMPLKYFDYNMATFRISEGMKSPSNPDNKRKYKRFQKEAHIVSRRHGGTYFSTKLLQRFAIYGKYKYYLRRYESEPSVIGHDKLENAGINPLFMSFSVAVHKLLKPIIRMFKYQKG